MQTQQMKGVGFYKKCILLQCNSTCKRKTSKLTMLQTIFFVCCPRSQSCRMIWECGYRSGNYYFTKIQCTPSKAFSNYYVFILCWKTSVSTCNCLIYTSGHMEQIFNPFGVALGASLESRCFHMILESSI